MFNRRAVFLDRDGTLVESIIRPNAKKQVTAPFTFEELKFVPRVEEVIVELKKMGFLTVLVTNQPDVAHGILTEEEWTRIQRAVELRLALDDVWMCRHRREDNCPFKKPSPLMLQAAACKWNIDLSKSWMIGDTDQDISAGRAAGSRTILIDHPYNKAVLGNFTVPSLYWILTVIRDNSK